MNIPTLIITVLLVLAVLLAVRHIVRSRKNGCSACGMSCSGCSGACSVRTGKNNK